MPVHCAYHSPDPDTGLHEFEQKQYEETLPQELLDAIHNAISTVFDFMLDTLSASPQNMTVPTSDDEVRQESRRAAHYDRLTTDDDVIEEELYTVMLWNDEHHSFAEVIDQVVDATGCTEAEAKRIADRVDAYVCITIL
jgi:E3 ubiquitin-protein ligase UBR1